MGETGGIATVTGAVGDVFGLVGTVINQIISQPILVFFLAVAFIGVGIGVFRHMKRAVR